MLERLSLKQAFDKIENSLQFVTNATIAYINSIDITYVSCEYCSAGVATGSCKTHGINFGQYRLLYNLEIHLEQEGGKILATGFDNIGTHLFGMDASSLIKRKEDDPDAFNKVFTDTVQKKYELRLSYAIIVDEDSDKNEVKCTINSIDI